MYIYISWTFSAVFNLLFICRVAVPIIMMSHNRTFFSLFPLVCLLICDRLYSSGRIFIYTKLHTYNFSAYTLRCLTHSIQWYRVHCAVYSSMKNDSLFCCVLFLFLNDFFFFICVTLSHARSKFTWRFVLILQFIFLWLFEKSIQHTIQMCVIVNGKYQWHFIHFYHRFTFIDDFIVVSPKSIYICTQFIARLHNFA